MFRYLLICLCLQSFLPAQEAVRLDALVEQLGHDDFKLRQAASDELMRRVEKDPEFLQQLKRFTNDDDPEIRVRIAELFNDLPVVLPWMDPAMEKEVKSARSSFNSMKLMVKNRSKIEIKTYWIDWDGKRQQRRSIKPGEEIAIAKTYEGHPWLLTDTEGKGLGMYIPTGKKEVQIIYTGKEGLEK